MPGSHRLTSVALLGAMAFAAACEIGDEIVSPPDGKPQLVLHAVLNPTATQQIVLLERAWDGRQFVYQVGQEYSTQNPIFTGGGSPELNAVIDVTLPTGVVVRATPLSGGRYLLSLPTAQWVPGGTFQLRVQSTGGEVLTSHLTTPAPRPLTPIVRDTFDTKDTVRLTWEAVPYTRAYQVIVTHLDRSWTMFTESTSVTIPGNLRHTQMDGLPPLFLPGFDQRVAILAVDSNYYDYYRSTNNGFTGRGLANRIEGGIGVFGVAATLMRRESRVTAAFTLPLEGRYAFAGTPTALDETLLREMTLHVAAAGVTDALSGRFHANQQCRSTCPPWFVPSDTLGAFVGRRWKDTVEVTILSGQSIVDTIDVLRARIRGDTLVGRYRFRGDSTRLVLRRPD